MSENHQNIAVIGTGYWGKNLVRNFSELGALRLICDANQQTLTELTTKFNVKGVTDFAEVLANPDIQGVVIATPAITHFDLVMQALTAGKDVFVEKPLALNLQDAIDIKSAVNQSNQILMVGHLLEYHPALVKLRQIVTDGKIGKIQYIYSNRLSFGKIRTEENVLWSFTPHDICMILGFLGEIPHTVQAFGSANVTQVEDFCVINLEFSQNVKAHVFASWLHPFKEHRLVVVGDVGTLVFDDVSKDAKLVLYDQQITVSNGIPILEKKSHTPIAVGQNEPLKLECQHFLDCIQTRQTPVTDVDNGINVLTVLQAAQISLQSKGKIIDPKEV
jgi:predicted dehydrogenase